MVAPSLAPAGSTTAAATQPATSGAAGTAAEPVRVVVRVRPEPIEGADAPAGGEEQQQQLCVFAEGETGVSIVSANKDHLSRTVASAARGRQQRQQQRQRQHPESTQQQPQQTQARSFNLDRVFGPFASQRDVYEEAARPLIRSVVDG